MNFLIYAHLPNEKAVTGCHGLRQCNYPNRPLPPFSSWLYERCGSCNVANDINELFKRIFQYDYQSETTANPTSRYNDVFIIVLQNYLPCLYLRSISSKYFSCSSTRCSQEYSSRITSRLFEIKDSLCPSANSSI